MTSRLRASDPGNGFFDLRVFPYDSFKIANDPLRLCQPDRRRHTDRNQNTAFLQRRDKLAPDIFQCPHADAERRRHDCKQDVAPFQRKQQRRFINPTAPLRHARSRLCVLFRMIPRTEQERRQNRRIQDRRDDRTGKRRND